MRVTIDIPRIRRRCEKAVNLQMEKQIRCMLGFDDADADRKSRAAWLAYRWALKNG